jgi:putative ATP-binding cassette transporter
VALSIVRLLGREGAAPRTAILAMAGIAGASMSLLMAAINLAADRMAAGELGLQTPLVFLLAWSMHNVAQRYAATQAALAAESSLRKARMRVADKVRRSGLRFIEEQDGVTAFDPLLRDAGMLSHGVVLLVRGAKSTVLVVSAMIYTAWISPPSALVLILMLVVLLPLLASHLMVTAGELQRTDAADARYGAELGGLLAGFKELMADRRAGDSVAAELERLALEAEAMRKSTNRRQVRETLLTEGGSYLALALVVFVVPALVAESVSTVLTVTATAFFLIGPVMNLAAALPMLAKVDAAVAALYALEDRLDRASSEGDGLTPTEAIRSFEHIALERVEFHYPDRDGRHAFGLGPLDLTIRQGEMIFIVGGNGSGKSTLLKLLTGLYRPTRGRLLLDGAALDDATWPRYRTLFAAVFTDFHLFERLYGLPDIEPVEVNRRLAELGLGEKTRYSAEGFTELALSTGQKKRIALLGAQLKGRAVLVLDELAADQDPTFRRRYYREILPGLKAAGQTLICVTHDDQYFDVADRVLVMREGRLSAHRQ